MQPLYFESLPAPGTRCAPSSWKRSTTASEHRLNTSATRVNRSWIQKEIALRPTTFRLKAVHKAPGRIQAP